MSASGTPGKSAASSAGSCSGPAEPGDHQIAQHGRRAQCPAPRQRARRADVAHQRGRVAGLAQHLRHQPADVHVVFDDENDFSRASTSFALTSQASRWKNAARVEDDILLGVKQTREQGGL